MSTMKYTLRSSDGDSFEVEEPVAIMSTTVKHIIDDDCFDNGIPLPNVSSKILSKVIEYCKKHVAVAVAVAVAAAVETTVETDGEKDAPDAGFDLKAWDREFIVALDQATLFDLVMAANYLNIKDLLELTCQSIADLIKDKTPEEVRTIFNITNDFTEEEEKQVRAENAWAFE